MAAAVVKPTDKPFWSQPQSESNMRLAGAAVADRDHVVAASDVFAASELQDQCLIERRDRREVKTVQALHCFTVGNRASLMRRSTMRRSRSISSSSARRSK